MTNAERYGTKGSTKGIWIKYEMTEVQYRVFIAMKPGCWICGRTRKTNGLPLKLFTDHDHKNGRVRGRLDYACNRRLIGRRRDGDLYRRAADYLDSTFDGRKIEVPKRVPKSFPTEERKATKSSPTKARAATVRLRARRQI